MIECINLTKYYGKQEVVSGLSFMVDKGKIFLLLGPNRAGKTTTIRMILGLTQITQGQVKIKSEERIGYSPEFPYFINYLSAYEIMRFYAKLQHIEKKYLNDEVYRCLECVGLTDAKDKKIKVFSKGMLQRLAVAQALLGSPSILILDEPCAGLDALGRIEMMNLVLKLKEKGHTIILNSHILGDVERMADKVLIINKGKKLLELDMKIVLAEYPNKSLEKIFIEVLGSDYHDRDN